MSKDLQEAFFKSVADHAGRHGLEIVVSGSRDGIKYYNVRVRHTYKDVREARGLHMGHAMAPQPFKEAVLLIAKDLGAVEAFLDGMTWAERFERRRVRAEKLRRVRAEKLRLVRSPGNG